MSHFSVEIAGRECFVRADEAPRFLLVQTLGRHERAGFDRTADLVAAAVGAPVVLVALWAASQTDRFAAIVAASPSLWIRDWLDFAGSHPVRTGKVYLSLGDREEHARNRSIARVGDCVRGEYELLQRQLGAQDCTLVWNPGGHFQDEDKRLAAAFGWCAAQLHP